MGSQGCQRRKSLVVHFNCLKPCNAGVPLTNEFETRPVVQGDPPAGQEFDDEKEATLGDIVIFPDTYQRLSSPEKVPIDSESGPMPSRNFLTENSSDQDVPAQVPEETARGERLNHQIIIGQWTLFHHGGSSVMDTMDMFHTRHLLSVTSHIVIALCTMYKYTCNHAIVYLGFYKYCQYCVLGVKSLL